MNGKGIFCLCDLSLLNRSALALILSKIQEMKYGLILLLFLMSWMAISAEHDQQHEPHWRGVLLIGHTWIDTHEWNSDLIIPSIGFDLEYWPTHRFGIGLHSDMEIQSFVLEREVGEVVERELPLVSTVDLLWKPWKDLVIMAGPGIEFERTMSYPLWRIGFEYEIEFGHHWDISPTIFYDNRFGEEYNTISFALGIGKRF